MKFKGVFVANITPFDSQNRISLKDLDKHLEFLMQSRIAGLVPCGTTGESDTLNPKEWETVVKRSTEIAKAHQLQVIAGCGSNSTAVVEEKLKIAEGLGCDAALVVTPYYNRPTELGIKAHYEHLLQTAKIPIVLYNNPGRANLNVSPPLLGELFKHPNMVGIKEANASYAQWLAHFSMLSLEKKSVLAGNDDCFAPILALGGSGIISTGANLVPEWFCKLYKLSEQGEMGQAFDIQKKLYPLISALFSETSPAPLKYALEKAYQIGGNRLRLPLVPIQSASAKRLDAILTSFELI